MSLEVGGKRKMIGPQLAYSDYLHGLKYRQSGEDFRESQNRLASSLSDNDRHFRLLRDIFLEQRFMPAGRIQAAIGSTKQITANNCYLSGTIEDSLVAGNGSIMQRLTEGVTTLRLGGGIGYDFSPIRPKGSLIKKLETQTGGVVGFIRMYNEASCTISSAGHRRGANMGVLRVDHPDIEDFIRAKQNPNDITAFNLSVAVTDEFMRCVKNNSPFTLRFQGQDYRTVSAKNLWEMIMRSTWDWGEPGVLFIDRINEMNNLWYCETIAATNPCGEQPLPPFGACLLGSFNLPKYISLKMVEDKPNHYIYENAQFNWTQLEEDIHTVVRAMDNVVDKALYPLFEQEKEAFSKRRMGIGVTGVANALEIQIGNPSYGSDSFCSLLEQVLRKIAITVYDASCDLAKEKGSFPMFQQKEYLQSKFIQQTMPEEIIHKIEKHGIRNSHLLSIAPTGTISLCADNVSSGIEPVFSYIQNRTVIENLGDVKQVEVPDYAYANWGFKGKRSKDVTVKEHLKVLETAYQWVDSAVSKTCNLPSQVVNPEFNPEIEESKDNPKMIPFPWSDFENIYFEAWEKGCKGCTTYNPEGQRKAMMVSNDNGIDEESGVSCTIDQVTGLKSCE